MDFLISCPCGHTLERHEVEVGCSRCTCMRSRAAALEAAVLSVRNDAPAGGYEWYPHRRKR